MQILTVTDRQPPSLPPVELVTSPAFDFLISLLIGLAEEAVVESHEQGPAWRATLRERGGEALLAEWGQVAGDGPACRGELGALMVMAATGPASVDGFLTALAKQPLASVARLMVLAYFDDSNRPPSARLTAAVDGERAAIAELLGALEGAARRRVALWLADTAGLWADLQALLRRWQAAVFAAEEERLRPILERDGALRRQVLTQQGAAALLQTIGGSLHLRLEPGVERLIIAPSVLVRPAIISVSDDEIGYWLVICPVADESLEAPADLAPPTALVRLYKALSDETRLKILRLLADDELYLTEIADRLGLTKATISHHMMLLRAAGLVNLRLVRKSEMYYRLDRSAINAVATQLRHFLALREP